jgi:hypothetical protein
LTKPAVSGGPLDPRLAAPSDDQRECDERDDGLKQHHRIEANAALSRAAKVQLWVVLGHATAGRVAIGG